jgi:hypothetical protein
MTQKKTLSFQTIIDILKAIKDYAIPFAGIIFAFLNIYLANKLNPVLSSIKDIVHRVEAVETKVNTFEVKCLELKQEHVEIKKELYDELKYLRGRIDSIYQVVR